MSAGSHPVSRSTLTLGTEGDTLVGCLLRLGSLVPVLAVQTDFRNLNGGSP
jgi:hypothetical protein